MKKLTAKEKIFVAKYIICLDPKKAALSAGFSKTMAETKAYQWVSNSKVKPHVYKAVKDSIKKIENKLEITAERIRDELGTIAFKTDADLNKKKCPFQSRDKIKSLELLAKHKNMFEEDNTKKLEVTVMNDIEVDGKPFILKVGKDPEEGD